MKSFNTKTDKIDKALEQFFQGGKNNAVICLVANNKYYRAWVPARELAQKERFRMEERLMRALIADRALFESFLHVVEPVRRYYRREDKKAQQSK